jgi:hypothetical protein
MQRRITTNTIQFRIEERVSDDHEWRVSHHGPFDNLPTAREQLKLIKERERIESLAWVPVDELPSTLKIADD